MSDLIREVKAPMEFASNGDEMVYYLAGSIINEETENWQADFVKYVNDIYGMNPKYKQKICLINPRRDEWDAEWDKPGHPVNLQQIAWEHKVGGEGEELYNFVSGTNAASALVFFAETCSSPENFVGVVVSKGFRKHDLVAFKCKHLDIPRYDSLLDMAEALCKKANED